MANRHRLVRVPAVLITCFSLLLSAGAPVAAHSSPKLTVSVASVPTSVTRGLPASYFVTVKNTSWTAIDNVKLETDAPLGFTFLSATTTKGTCSAAAGGEASCSIGKLNAGAQAQMTLIFNTAPTTALGLATFKVVVKSGSGYWHSSSGNTVTASVTTTILAVNPNLTTQFIPPPGGEITTGGVVGSSSLSPSNPQGTTAVVPATAMGVPAALSEFGGPNDACPAVYIGRCFGQASTVVVGAGTVLNPYLKVQVRYDKHSIPLWIWEHKLSVIHWFDPFPSAGYEEITRICSDSTPYQSELPCRLKSQRLHDWDLLITIFMESNGTIKGKG